MTKSC